MDYQVRKLNTRDLFTVTKILSKVIGDIREGAKNVQKMDNQVFGIIVMEAMMKHAEHDFKELLASLVGMSIEEFEKEPFDAPLVIIEKVNEQENLNDFLQKAQGMMSKLFGKS